MRNNKLMQIFVFGMMAILTSVSCLVFAFSFFAFGARCKLKPHLFLAQMQRVTTPAELQAWALCEIRQADEEFVELNSLPPFLTAPVDGPPSYAYIDTRCGAPHVIVQWGSGFGHWGLCVGEPTMNYPIDDYHSIEWAPGVFVWHEIQ